MTEIRDGVRLDHLLERFLNPLPEDFRAACAEWRGLNEESDTYAKGYARIIVKRMIDAHVRGLVDEAYEAKSEIKRLQREAIDRQMAETERHDAEIMRGMP